MNTIVNTMFYIAIIINSSFKFYARRTNLIRSYDICMWNVYFVFILFHIYYYCIFRSFFYIIAIKMYLSSHSISWKKMYINSKIVQFYLIVAVLFVSVVFLFYYFAVRLQCSKFLDDFYIHCKVKSATNKVKVDGVLYVQSMWMQQEYY